MDGFVVFQQMAIVVIFMGIGTVLFRTGRLKDTTRGDLAFLVAEVCSPAMILASGFSGSQMEVREFLKVGLLATGIFAVLILLGFLMPFLLRTGSEDGKYYHLMTVYYNIGFVGIPVVSAVLGQDALVYVSVFMLVFNFIAYTHGITLVTWKSEARKGSGWKKMINPGTIACTISLIVRLCGITAPAFVQNAFSYMGNCTTFLSMIVLGGALAKTSLKALFGEPRLYFLIGLRWLLVPVMMAFALKGMGLSGLLLQTIVLMISLPAANLPLMMANEYGQKCDCLSNGIILSTLFSVVTIPIVASVL